MASAKSDESQTASSGSQPQEEESFAFGQYVSPVPKRIALGVKLKPEPQVEYKTNHEVKTESKAVLDCVHDHDRDEVNECKSQESKKSMKAHEHFESQQSEIEALKAKLMALELENKRLMSHHRSDSTATRSADADHANDANTVGLAQPAKQQQGANDMASSKGKHICFNPSVEVLERETTAPSSSKIDIDQAKLTDKVSLVRSNRNSTPYKPKPTARSHATATATATATARATSTEREGSAELVHANDIHNASSRNNYRTTPIPMRKHRFLATKQRRTLTTIFDRELAIDENVKRAENAGGAAANKENISQSVQHQKESQENDKAAKPGSFGFGATYTPIQSPKPERNTNAKGASAAPQSIQQLDSPLLTPVKGANTARKPFSFSWNTSRPEKPEKSQEK